MDLNARPYIHKDRIRTVHLELTAQCNLQCPQCARTYAIQTHSPLPKNSVTWDVLKNVFTAEFCKQLQHVYFCGNYGDPLASNEFLDVLARLRNLGVPKLTAFTNGSLRTPDYFQDLAKIMTSKTDLLVMSIDGLADTNDLYRVGSHWEKIMENAAAFIAAGGRARWDYLVFKHNAHQIKDAQKLAQAMGFAAFKLKYTTRFITESHMAENLGPTAVAAKRKGAGSDHVIDLPAEHEYRSQSLNRYPKILDQHGSFDSYARQTGIKCKSQSENSIYIDCLSSVWPCCWLGATRLNSSPGVQGKEIQKLMDRLGNFNSLLHHSFDEILNHVFFQKELANSWDDPSQRFFTCGRTCGSSYEFSSGAPKENFRLVDLKGGRSL